MLLPELLTSAFAAVGGAPTARMIHVLSVVLTQSSPTGVIVLAPLAGQEESLALVTRGVNIAGLGLMLITLQANASHALQAQQVLTGW